MSALFLRLVPSFGVIALFYALFASNWIARQDFGTERMKEIAGYIRQGAMAFMSREYGVLAIFVGIVALLLGISNASSNESHALVALSFVVGAGCSALSGFVGMRVATLANVRTASAARTGLAKALGVAFVGGSVMGMSVVGLGILGLSGLFLLYLALFGIDLTSVPANLQDPMLVETKRVLTILAGFSLGASSIALFARVVVVSIPKRPMLAPTWWARSRRASPKMTHATPL